MAISVQQLDATGKLPNVRDSESGGSSIFTDFVSDLALWKTDIQTGTPSCDTAQLTTITTAFSEIKPASCDHSTAAKSVDGMFKIGDRVKYKESKGRVSDAIIEELDPTKNQVRITFPGFSTTWDEWIDVKSKRIFKPSGLEALAQDGLASFVPKDPSVHVVPVTPELSHAISNFVMANVLQASKSTQIVDTRKESDNSSFDFPSISFHHLLCLQNCLWGCVIYMLRDSAPVRPDTLGPLLLTFATVASRILPNFAEELKVLKVCHSVLASQDMCKSTEGRKVLKLSLNRIFCNLKTKSDSSGVDVEVQQEVESSLCCIYKMFHGTQKKTHKTLLAKANHCARQGKRTDFRKGYDTLTTSKSGEELAFRLLRYLQVTNPSIPVRFNSELLENDVIDILDTCYDQVCLFLYCHFRNVSFCRVVVYVMLCLCCAM